MSKTNMTKTLETEIYNHTRKMGTFGAFEVTIGWYGHERVDYMTYDTKGIFRCYEIKQSLNDFNSKAIISFVGDYNYYVLTEELYKKVKDKIPNDIGVWVYVPKCSGVVSRKKAKRRELSIDRELLLACMLRSVCREADKVYQNKDEARQTKHIKELERTIIDKQRDSINLRRKYNILIMYLYENCPDIFDDKYDDFIYKMSTKKAVEIDMEINNSLIDSSGRHVRREFI